MERIGKYEIRGKLGEGATSVVHLAYDPFTQREVALKAIYPHVLKDKQKGLMYRHLLVTEASLAGKLQHPHIVQIFDAVVDDELSYIVMEYVRGGTLEQFCNPDRLLPIDRLVEIVFKCTRALDYAQHLGITHRDIKPANILLAQPDNTSGDIKISDFGAALTPGGEHTQVAGVGSPAYMSPQQVREMPLDQQTDIYSLGVVMYQLLTGRLPFQASNNYSMIYQICNTTPPPPSTFRSDVPPMLDTVVSRAMQRDLEARYQTWEEFSQALARSFRNQQLSAKRQAFPDIEKFESLRAFSFFNKFSDIEIWEIVRFSVWDEVVPETVLMKDGEAGDSFSFLIDGELRVSKRGKTLNLLNAGEVFGEMAVIGTGGNARSADVIALTAAKVATVSGTALRHASDTCRMHFYEAFLEVMSVRLALANIRLAAT